MMQLFPVQKCGEIYLIKPEIRVIFTFYLKILRPNQPFKKNVFMGIICTKKMHVVCKVSPLVMLPMLRWEKCSSGRFPSRNPYNVEIAETDTHQMMSPLISSSCVLFLGMDKTQQQSRQFITINPLIFPCECLSHTDKHGGSCSDFRPVALEKLDN